MCCGGALANHIEQVQMYRYMIDCAHCGRSFKDKRALRAHIRMSNDHPDDPKKRDEIFEESVSDHQPEVMSALEKYALALKMEDALDEIERQEMGVTDRMLGKASVLPDGLREKVEQKKRSAKKDLLE